MTVVETGKSSDGSQWYRLWSDGWLEQGGYVVAGSVSTVSLLKSFANTSYTVSCTSIASHGEIYAPSVEKVSNSQIKIYTSSYATGIPKDYYVCGQS